MHSVFFNSASLADNPADSHASAEVLGEYSRFQRVELEGVV